MRLPPTPCRVCFRPRVFNKFSHFWQKQILSPAQAHPQIGSRTLTDYSSLPHLCTPRYRGVGRGGGGRGGSRGV